MLTVIFLPSYSNSADQLRHPRSDAYSAELVLLNKLVWWSLSALFPHGLVATTAPTSSAVFQIFVF